MMGIGKLCYSMQGPEFSILHYDVEYFGLSDLSLGSSLMEIGSEVGQVTSTALAVFLGPYHAVIVGLIVSLAQIAVICSLINERY